MPDISMCENKECPLRETCYRFMATPDYYQSYAYFKPKDNACDHYWPFKADEKDTLDKIHSQPLTRF